MAEEATYHENCCIKCRNPDDDLRVVDKGIQKLIDYSLKIDDKELYNYLCSKQEKGDTVRIHINCQKAIYNELKRKRSNDEEGSSRESAAKKVTRALSSKFNWKEKCFFCGEACIEDMKHPDRKKVRMVATVPFKESVLCTCLRRNDKWAEDVRRRLSDCNDLVAVEARYHVSCNASFGKHNNTTKSPLGRPTDSTCLGNFERICEWLESQCELCSLTEVHEKMLEMAGDSECIYSQKWLKVKLQEKYKEHIFFAEVNGKSNVICFREMANYLVNDAWFQARKQTPEEEAERIIKTAAKLVLSDIRSASFENSAYPTHEEIENLDYGLQWLPPYLRLFMQSLTIRSLKLISIGQAIVHLLRERSSVPPILFGLTVELDHVFGSKWLIKELNRLGFCLGWEEAIRYKQSVVENENIANYLTEFLPGSFTQWSADNVDHNVCTLDGKGTFHAMGLVSSTTCRESNAESNNAHLVKRQRIKRASEIVKGKGIEVAPYIAPEVSGLSKIVFKPRMQLMLPVVLPPDTTLDLLWHTAVFFQTEDVRPSWSGYMSNICTGEHPGKSTVTFLPIIDLDPTDMSCIYSTMLFVIGQARQLGMEVPVLTFDQPLWLKATEIANAKSLPIVLILGGFHLMMSYVGSLGCLMKGSGLQEALQTVYASNTVEHICSGKAIARALRGHFLVESALESKLIGMLLPVHLRLHVNYEDELHQESNNNAEDMSAREIEVNDEELHGNNQLVRCPQESVLMDDNTPSFQLPDREIAELFALFESVEKEPDNDAVEHACNSEVLRCLNEKLMEYKHELCKSSRTAKLWIQYLGYVEILKLFIRAERTGNWSLHLEAINQMINILAATGHIHYAKSARLHLQNMLELPSAYPWVHANFAEHGYHTVRRSDRYWAGLWTDLIIEQVLMRSLKSRGGLTRGRGVTESIRILWTNSMHRCAGIHNAMSNLTGMQHKSSEQHVELGNTRIKRDHADLLKLIGWFEEHSPFDMSQPSLRSLASGVTATPDDNINCDEAEAVGAAIQQKLDGICVEDATMKRKDQVRTLESLRPGVRIEGKTVHIDPCILFTRLTTILGSDEDVIKYFDYELTPEPTAIFKDGMLRKPTKATLRNSLLDKINTSSDVSFHTCVVDGGALLHKVHWPANSTFIDIVRQYVSYLQAKYGQYQRLCIVFDGYTDSNSNKSQEHLRRGGITSANINVQENLKVSYSREVLLRNPSNKEKLIQLLTKHFKTAGFTVFQSSNDADVLIVEKAIEYASELPVVVSADDTDILVLLLYHWERTLKSVYFSTERGTTKKSKMVMYWDIEELVNTLPDRKYILFAHAWTGCDTTSALYRKGKNKILQLLQNKDVKELADHFGHLDAKRDDLGNAGCKLIIKCYKGKSDDSIGKLRYFRYLEMITTCAQLQPEKLPPTSRAIYYHALRVNLQVCQWRQLNNSCLNAEEWGWKRENGLLAPVKTDCEVAPEWLLTFVRCKCKPYSRNPCGTMVCSCRKNGLSCVEACGECRGEACNNQPEITIIDDDDNADHDI